MSVMESNIQQSRFVFVPIAIKDEYPRGFMALGPLEGHLNQSGNQAMSLEHSNADEDLVSDCESGISGTTTEGRFGLFDDGLIRVDEEDKQLQFIKQRFLSSLNEHGLNTQVEAIHKNAFSSLTAQARVQSISIFSRAIEKKGEGHANLKYAWYGASKDEIRTIFSHGFGNTLNDGVYGRGIYLSPANFPLGSIQSTHVDEDGLRHLVLCRVILGRTELVQPGSEQSYPSSERFDSGVDNLLSPKTYIVWSTHMNTHILPEYVISFRTPSRLKGHQRISASSRKPSSPWMPFPTLISELSKFLAPSSIQLIRKYHNDHREKRITRQDLIRRVRQITGDDLLVVIIKSYRNKLDTSRILPSINNLNECQKQSGRFCAGSKAEGFKLF